MSCLVSTTKSQVAHLSYDGETAACGTLLHGAKVAGSSMGFVQATQTCQHCPQEGFSAYFDNLRRGIMAQADREYDLSKTM